jgi:hypothetical protein
VDVTTNSWDAVPRSMSTSTFPVDVDNTLLGNNCLAVTASISTTLFAIDVHNTMLLIGWMWDKFQKRARFVRRKYPNRSTRSGGGDALFLILLPAKM